MVSLIAVPHKFDVSTEKQSRKRQPMLVGSVSFSVSTCRSSGFVDKMVFFDTQSHEIDSLFLLHY